MPKFERAERIDDCQRRAFALAAIVLLGAPAASFIGVAAVASPAGAEWQTATDPKGCVSCHLGSPDPTDSPALTLAGLPERPEPGKTYTLTLILTDPALRNAGFLLMVTSGNAPAGRLQAIDERTEVLGTMARSTRAGAVPAERGRADWQLAWQAPDPLMLPITFELWGNAGNDDLSPLGDNVHHRVLQLPPAR